MTKMFTVQVSDETLAQLDNTMNTLNAPTRSDTMRRAITLQHAMVTAMSLGYRIVIEGHGEKREIEIPISKHN